MTIFYDHRQFETLSFDKNKNEEQHKLSQDISLKPNICNRCTQIITDKFYYEVDGFSWHSSCLRCYSCQVNLSNMRSCFCKNDKIWCRQDYNRHFRCQKCFEMLKPSDLIMRSGSFGFPYHVGCFRCDACNVLLLTGDSYGCSSNRLFCKNDFLTTQRSISLPYDNDVMLTGNLDANITMTTIPSNPLSALCQLSMDEYIKNKLTSPMNSMDYDKNPLCTKATSISNNDDREITVKDIPTEGSPVTKEYTPLKSCVTVKDINYDDSNLLLDSSKVKMDTEIQLKIEKVSSPTSNYDQDDKVIDEATGSNELSSETDLGKEALDHNSILEASTFGTEDDDPSGASCSGDSEDKMALAGKQGLSKKGSNNLRQKRVRTSFKHQQLRTMKAYFAMNHNPDSKDLRQLSQKTGLSKRVLQVWFQNARAKFRRSLCRQSGIMCPPSSNQMQMSNVFDDSMMNLDKNGNYSNKSKMTAFTDISSSILNHSVPNNHRMCSISEMGYSTPNNSGSLLPSLTNMRDRYLPNGKQFIPTSNYYNSPMNPQSQNSPSLFSMDVGNLAANLGLSEFSRDNVESFHLTELSMGQKLSSSI